MDNFLPPDYKSPEGNYLKLQEGENTFRVLSSAITGYEYFNKDNKPVRSKTPFTNTPSDIKEDGSVKHFWAFVVYSYRAEKAQILSISQTSIQGAIKALVDNVKWGSPKGYDITITRSGSGFDTEYNIVPNPHSEFPTDIILPTVNLEALYSGGDPFAV